MENKIAVITGISSGIGQAVYQKLSQNNYFVYGISRKPFEITGGGKNLVCDLADTNAVNELTNKILSEVKQIDLIINIAGIWHGENSAYSDTNFDKFSQKIVLDTMTVGILAPMVLVHNLLPIMPKNSKIINLSGTFENGGKGWLPYFVSKRALEDFTVGLADDLKDREIKVNCVSPSDVATPAYKKYFPKYASDALLPEEVAEEIYKICLDAKTTGKIFVVKKDQPTSENFHY